MKQKRKYKWSNKKYIIVKNKDKVERLIKIDC